MTHSCQPGPNARVACSSLNFARQLLTGRAFLFQQDELLAGIEETLAPSTKDGPLTAAEKGASPEEVAERRERVAAAALSSMAALAALLPPAATTEGGCAWHESAVCPLAGDLVLRHWNQNNTGGAKVTRLTTAFL